MQKRKLLSVIGVGLAAAAALVGSDLLDLYRFDQYMSASAKEYEAAGPWPHLADACDVCHGANGNAQNQGYPKLAGQPAAYLTAQLRNFASQKRINPIMNPMAMTLSEADIAHLAEHYAQQKVAENKYFEAGARLQAKGKELVANGGCGICHGDQLMGKDQFPRLAGQGYDYVLKQLDAFAGGSRRDIVTGMMNTLASAWSAEDRMAIATYLASHPVGQ